MAKFKVLKKFKDTHTKDIYEVNDEIEMTVKRSEEVAKNLDGSYLERLDAQNPKTGDENTDGKIEDEKSKEADK